MFFFLVFVSFLHTVFATLKILRYYNAHNLIT